MNDYEIRQDKRKERLERRAALCEKLARVRLEQAQRMSSCIPMGQPILIGHHSEKRDRNFRAKIDRNFRKAYELEQRAKYYAGRAASVGTAGISSDDPAAIVKLQAQIDRAEALQARMVAANKAVRKNDRAALEAQGFTPQQIEELFKPDFMGRLGFPGYELTNNNANIRRMKQRIEQLRREHTNRETLPTEDMKTADGITISENTALNRLQIFFPGKPAEDVRARLKSFGFRWSPTEGAWQRQLNDAARYAAKSALRLEEAKK